MKKAVFVVYDPVAEEIATLFLATNDKHARQIIRVSFAGKPAPVIDQLRLVCVVTIDELGELVVSSEGPVGDPVTEILASQG